jgi:hypothetical protein
VELYRGLYMELYMELYRAASLVEVEAAFGKLLGFGLDAVSHLE